MRILLNGICGHMGREVVKLAKAGYRDAEITVGVDVSATGEEAPLSVKSFSEIDKLDGVDCIIDFSHHSCVSDLLAFAVENGIPTVVATTGHTSEEVLEIKEASRRIPVFFSANMSLGVALLVELAKKASLAMPDAEIEIIEKHHNRKLDAPSGTALMIANAIIETRKDSYVNCGRDGQGKRTKEEIGISSLRMGNVVGVHEVHICTPTQSLTLRHDAITRGMLADGAVDAARFMEGKGVGFYNMESILNG